MRQYQAGNQIECLFCFTNRPLVQLEQAEFLKGNGLPAGVGVDQPVIFMDYVINSGQKVTLSGNQVIRDAVGCYHGIIVARIPGTYSYYGYSQDGQGNPLASTPKNTFTVVAFP